MSVSRRIVRQKGPFVDAGWRMGGTDDSPVLCTVRQMGNFVAETLSRAPQELTVPEPVRLLLEWVEVSGFVEVGQDGDLYGSLSAGWPNGPGTNVLLRGDRPEEVANLLLWLGAPNGGLPTLWPFCRTGADGSLAALWLDPTGETRIVHMGSGSGSVLACVLGDNAVDFLRLLAIGYDEVCWNEDWALPPQADAGRSPINLPFRSWVEVTFSVEIPKTGLDIIPAPAEMGDTETTDPWCLWLNSVQG